MSNAQTALLIVGGLLVAYLTVDIWKPALMKVPGTQQVQTVLHDARTKVGSLSNGSRSY